MNAMPGAVAAVVVILLAAAAFAFRQEIMAMMANEANAGHSTSVAAAPAKMTMPDPPARAQLEIDVAASKVELVDGRYVVQGEIVNTGQATGSASTLKLTFKKDNDVLGERSYALVQGPIAPGARLGAYAADRRARQRGDRGERRETRHFSPEGLFDVRRPVRLDAGRSKSLE